MVVAEHLNGELEDITFEMIGMAKSLGSTINVALLGGTDDMVGQLGAAANIYRVDCGSNYNPESYSAALKAVVDAKSPQIVMVGNSSMGMDMANTLSAQNGMPLAAACKKISGGGNTIVEAGLFGGKINVTSDLGTGPCVVSVAAGSVLAEEGKGDGSPATENIEMPSTSGKVRFKKLIMPESADVDITAKEVLVAIGRGIGSKDDIEVAEELAETLDAAVAASRPIIDAG
ncbi:MAG: electron transfer flavoprotein subunit alpha/FixB family protein, partial [Chloroflexi bacterium]|nr:electron transfer flavoprotein subunit alpha/FixB family protein [Chloroflexota bacterium]